jgi:hypothetical protein
MFSRVGEIEMKSSVIAIALNLVAGARLAEAYEPVLHQIHRAQKVGNTWSGQPKHDPLQKIRRRLAWALGTATIALIVNAVAVVTLVGAG